MEDSVLDRGREKKLKKHWTNFIIATNVNETSKA